MLHADLVILGRTLEDLQQLVVSFKQPKFRAKQMYDAMLKGARSIDDIGTIPRGFREELKAQASGLASR